ncbi:tripartite tricarboxylate transporter TctB family protein [Frigoribacterium sp. VKM Ac-2836]|nr:tripartite tricarboxylate transporter TctB family protein [Frigoribacterium sp. VKM Ac-2836]NRD27707.1 tripartite tricarboxylate transporter TctB family protein [Frigoribacterium sp. VKM Ac-2836]
MLVIGLALVVGTVTMRVPDTATSPGPQVFPAIVAALVLIVAVLLAVDVVRKPEAATVEIAQPAAPGDVDDLDLDGEPVERRPTSNRRALLGALGTVVVFIAALTPLGWLLAGAVLFWGIARSLGSQRPVFDVFLALAISSIVQLAFSAGLGLNLPPGIFEGIF